MREKKTDAQATIENWPVGKEVNVQIHGEWVKGHVHGHNPERGQRRVVEIALDGGGFTSLYSWQLAFDQSKYEREQRAAKVPSEREQKVATNGTVLEFVREDRVNKNLIEVKTVACPEFPHVVGRNGFVSKHYWDSELLPVGETEREKMPIVEKVPKKGLTQMPEEKVASAVKHQQDKDRQKKESVLLGYPPDIRDIRAERKKAEERTKIRDLINGVSIRVNQNSSLSWEDEIEEALFAALGLKEKN